MADTGGILSSHGGMGVALENSVALVLRMGGLF